MTLPVPQIQIAETIATGDDAKPKQTLTSQTADGAVWIIATTVLTRVLGIVSQLALTRLLFPAELGLVSLATFVGGIAGFIGTLGLSPFLVTRQKSLHLYANTAFWLSIVLGLISVLFLILSAPIGAWIYHEQRIFGLLLFNCLTAMVISLGTVPIAVVYIRLQFKAVAGMLGGSMTAQVVVSVVAAWLGCGAYSIFMGTAAAAATRLIIAIQVTKLRFNFTRRYSFRAERVLLGSASGWMLGTGILNVLLTQGDYATMGFFFDKTNIGYYYFAFNLAQQAVILFSASLGMVLHPAIASISEDRGRQIAAITRAVRLLMVAGAPAGFLLVFLMPPIVHVFGAKYWPSIPVAQVMAAGSVALLASGPASALIVAQGRFRFQFFHTLLMTAMFLPIVFLGCLTHSVLGVATAVAIFFWIGGPLGLMLAIDGVRLRTDTARGVMSAMGLPTLCSLPAIAAGLLVFFKISSNGRMSQELVRSGLSGGVFLAIVIPCLWLAMPATAKELIHVGHGVLRRLLGRKGDA